MWTKCLSTFITPGLNQEQDEYTIVYTQITLHLALIVNENSLFQWHLKHLKNVSC